MMSLSPIFRLYSGDCCEKMYFGDFTQKYAQGIYFSDEVGDEVGDKVGDEGFHAEHML